MDADNASTKKELMLSNIKYLLTHKRDKLIMKIMEDIRNDIMSIKVKKQPKVGGGWYFYYEISEEIRENYYLNYLFTGWNTQISNSSISHCKKEWLREIYDRLLELTDTQIYRSFEECLTDDGELHNNNITIVFEAYDDWRNNNYDNKKLLDFISEN